MNSLTQIPPGAQILIGDAARRRRAIERAIFSVFEGWSYEEIIPPMFDYFDVFVKGMGNELEERIYRFIDREGNILALRPEGSYTTYLFDSGLDKILKKVGEEATETIVASKNQESQELVSESSDLIYHLMVLLVERGVSLEEITRELKNRHASQSGRS